MIEEGKPAADFTMSDQDGTPVTLSDLRGRWVVLYFYPKADTPGCTTQACGVQDRSSEYEDANATVLGVSPDPVGDLRAFADKYGLAFTLLSDEGHRVADDYGVWALQKFGDREVWANMRSTAIIDPDGKVARVFPEVDPATHDELVLGALRELGAERTA